MTLYHSIEETIGATPLLRLARLEKVIHCKANLFAKLECFNPAGSIKDRIAYAMIQDAELQGVLKPGATIIEPTSGNTGVGLASVAAARGYRLIIVMPDSMSIERRNLIEAYGAQLVLTPAADGMKGAIAKAGALHREINGSIVVGQFVNPANPYTHEQTTGPEIWEDLRGNIDALVVGVGTGGTITGISHFLRQKKCDIHIAAIEPSASPVLSQGVAGTHGIQGIGAGFIPDTLDAKTYDEVIPISDEDAVSYMHAIAHHEGILVGLSSGAAFAGALELGKRPEFFGKNIVIIFPDSGERYLSIRDARG
ncbi:MAG: cysteine synthase A [Eggerthellaceae bacterium]|nr:cysteine synthase A [Eggerthellaceae bacterium]